MELAHMLSADSTIMAIQRMAARRGASVRLNSDNDTNFHGTEKELKAVLATR